MVETTTTSPKSNNNSNVQSSSRMKTARRVLGIKKGWSKIKKTAKQVRRVFTRKRKSWDLDCDSQLEVPQNEGSTDANYYSSLTENRQLNRTFTKGYSEIVGHSYGIGNSPCTGASRSIGRQRLHFKHQSIMLSNSFRKSPRVVFTEMKRASFGRYRQANRAPPVVPPTSAKSELFSGAEVFRTLDRRAVQFARSQWCDLKRMTRKLIRNCQSDLEKARILFRWVVARDLIVRNARSLNWTVSTVNDVTDLRNSRELFHRLYQVVCSYAGLPCQIIHGYSKGAGYKPGMRIRGETFRNSWTAVAIDDQWRLVNCTWAARQVIETELSTCDEFYFLTDPKEHIFQHYPDDPRWQLLEDPLPFSEFTKLPFVRSPFFNHSLRFSSCYSSTIFSETGAAEIRLSLPGDIKLGSQLKPSRRNPILEPNAGVSLRHTNREAIFTVMSSHPGVFYFSVYVAGPDKAQCLENACSFAVKFLGSAPTTL